MELNDLKQKKNHQGLKMHLALIVQVAIVAHCGQITKWQQNILESKFYSDLNKNLNAEDAFSD